MESMAKHMLAVEKGWILSRIGKPCSSVLKIFPLTVPEGLIPDCDDDVMDEVRYLLAYFFIQLTPFFQQKWSSCSWLLLGEFVKMRRAQEKAREEAIASGEVKSEDLEDLPLPAISWVRKP
jgi:hypothetical protein